ncbi:hypothetical protein BKA69DRAFT_1085574 [Paraphysoderma sedebokerense]|nr:hypothetical protein BKA69DRAFT_1085574 [Paraphysoderma sedebokerense]
MGREKNQPRVKGNAKPASSSRAAELTGTATGTGFIGFNAFNTVASSSSSAPSFDPTADAASSIQELPSELVVILKKISKRDTTTKIKTLDELKTFLYENGKNKDQNWKTLLSTFLPVWPKLFTRLAIDVDRRCRISVYEIHEFIVRNVGKQLAPYLKSIIGTWVVSFYDVSKDVANLATNSFQAAFPPSKRSEVLVFCMEELLEFVIDTVLHKTPDTLSDPRYTSKEDMNAKYARVLSGCILSVIYIFENVPEEQMKKASSHLDILMNDVKFWGLIGSEHSLIRKSMYNLVKFLASHHPGYIEEARINLVSSVFLPKAFDEKDVLIHGDMWEALLTFLKRFPSSWGAATTKKPLVNKLWLFLRMGCYGSIGVSYPAIVVLISSLPDEITSTPAFYQDLFTNYLKGLAVGVIDKSNAEPFLQSYADILFYSLAKGSSTETSLEMLSSMKIWFMKLIDAFFFESKAAELRNKFQPGTLCRIIVQFLARLASRIKLKPALEEIWGEVSQRLISNISSSGNGLSAGEFKTFSARSSDFLLGMNQQITPSMESDVSKVLTESLSGTVQGVINAAFTTFSSCKGDQLDGFTLLLSSLYTTFHSMISPTSTQHFVSTLYMPSLATCVNVSNHVNANTLFKLLISILVATANDSSQALREWVPNVIHNIIEVPQVTEQSKSKFLLLLLKQVADCPLKVLAQSPLLDKFVESRSQAILADSSDIESFHLVSLCLRCHHDEFMLSENTILKILHSCAEVSHRYTTSLAFITSPVDPSTSNHQIPTIYQLLPSLFNSAHSLDMLLGFAADDLKTIVGDVFELYFISSDTLPEQLGVVIKDCLDKIIVNLKSASLNSQAEMLISNSFIDRISCTIMNVKHVASVPQLTSQIVTLLPLKNCRDELLSKTVFNAKFWDVARQSHLTYSTIPLIVTSPVMIHSTSATSVANECEYDNLGFTSYTRLAVTCLNVLRAAGVDILLQRRDLDSVGVLAEVSLFMEALSDEVALKRRGIVDSTTVDTKHLLNSVENELNLLLSEFLNQNSTLAPSWVTDYVIKADAYPVSSTSPTLTKLLCYLVQHSIRDNRYLRPFHSLISRVIQHYGFQRNDVLEWFVGLDIPQMDRIQYGEVICVTLDCVSAMCEDSVLFESFRMELATTLSKVQDIATSNQGRTHLSLLTSFSNQSDTFSVSPSSPFVSTDKAKSLLSHFDTWFESSAFAAEDEPLLWPSCVIVIQIFMLLESLLKSLGMDLESEEFEVVIGRCWNWLDRIATIEKPQSDVILFYILKVLSRLISLTDQKDSLKSVYDEYEEFIQEKLFDLFVTRGNFVSEASTPESRLLHLLTDLIINIPSKIIKSQSSADDLYKLIRSRQASVQRCAYLGLRRIAGVRVQEISLILELTPIDEESQEMKLPNELMDLILRPVHKIIVDDSTTEIDLHEVFGYLLSWKIIFDHFDNATFQLKSIYVDQLRFTSAVPNLLNLLFQILVSNGMGSSFDLTKWGIEEYDVHGFDVTSILSFNLFSAHIYHRALVHIPTLVRLFWTECRHRQLTLAVESYTQTHFSPLIISSELSALQDADRSSLPDVNIRVARLSNVSEINAVYKIEDTSIEMTIKLPNNYPLRQVEVEGGKRAGVSEGRWRSWLLSCQAIMSAQNGSILDALRIFQRNVSLHFEGVGECSICYSIVGVIDKSLPNRPCKTCKNKFHSACLYKWFKSSNQSTCPLCRSLF